MQSRLQGAEFFEWMGLSRVRRGGVACFEGHYYDRGRAIPGYLVPDVLAALLDQELLVVTEPDESGWRRVHLTEAGQARYLALVRKQRGVAVPPAEHPTDPAGRWSSAAPLAPPGGRSDPADHWLSDAPPAPGDRPDSVGGELRRRGGDHRRGADQ